MFKESGIATQLPWIRVRLLIALVLLISLAGTMAMAGVTTRVSVDSQGRESHGNLSSSHIGDIISASNGHYIVVFSSWASNLVPLDTNAQRDIFIHNSRTGKTKRVSVSSAGRQANGDSWDPRLSANGRYVTFVSKASNLVPGDTNNNVDVFIHDRKTGKTERVSVNTSGKQTNSGSWTPSLSANGRYVTFQSYATNLVPGNTGNNDTSADIFVYDRRTKVTSRVNVSTSGEQANWNFWAWPPSLSADGRYVAFASYASNLVVDDTNENNDIFVHDRKTGRTERVSVSTTGDQTISGSWTPSLSANGRYVVFESNAPNLVPGDTNDNVDIFIHDRKTGKTERVSVSTIGEQTNKSSWLPRVSANGRYVTFVSDASNLVPGDTNNNADVFIHDRKTGKTERVSVSTTGEQGFGYPLVIPSLSADGRYVAFDFNAANLVPGDTNGAFDVFVHDRLTTQLEGPHGASSCSDGLDNDKDGDFDERDSDCILPLAPLACHGMRATIVGKNRRDYIIATPHHDVIMGLGGDDVIRGGGGADIICGGEGNDRLYGDADNDLLFGDAGNDKLHGGLGNDSLDGGSGNDRLFGNAGDDTLRDWSGYDILDGGANFDFCLNYKRVAGRNILKNCENKELAKTVSRR